MSATTEIINKLFDFVLPKFCVHCGKFGHYLCQNCYNKIEFVSEHICPVCRKPAIDGLTHPSCQTRWQIDGIISAVEYHGPVRSLVRKLKYKPYSAKIYEEIDLILRRYFIGPDRIYPADSILIPVPLHFKKLKGRGFNQAELAAKTLSNIWALPIQTNLLQRIKQGVDQTSLSRKERIKNVHGLYQVNPLRKTFIKNKQFVLVDDVTTTGATLKKCARVLKQSGAKKVGGVTLARD